MCSVQRAFNFTCIILPGFSEACEAIYPLLSRLNFCTGNWSPPHYVQGCFIAQKSGANVHACIISTFKIYPSFEGQIEIKLSLKTSNFLNCYLEGNNYPCYSVITLKKSSTRNLAAIIYHNSHHAKYNPKRSCVMETNLLISDQTRTLYSWGVKLMIPKISSGSASSLFVLLHVP